MVGDGTRDLKTIIVLFLTISYAVSLLTLEPFWKMYLNGIELICMAFGLDLNQVERKQ